MIGQANLKNNFKLNHFTILVGNKGQGKKTFVNEFIKTLDYNIVYLTSSMEDIRTLINNAYSITINTLYIIYDADNMHHNAKNAILKIAEEPPDNVYILITLSDLALTLPTIISRATIYHMDNYSQEELQEYCKHNINTDICENMLDVDLISTYDLALFDKYINNIVTKVNHLPYSTLFRIKELLETFDIKLVLKAVINQCIQNNQLQMAEISSKYLSKLRISTLNQDMLIDNWLLEMNGVKV